MCKSVKITFVFLVIVVCLAIASTAQIYNGLNTGIVWNRGGIEIKPQLSLFVCTSNATGTEHYHVLPVLFPNFVTDC